MSTLRHGQAQEAVAPRGLLASVRARDAAAAARYFSIAAGSLPGSGVRLRSRLGRSQRSRPFQPLQAGQRRSPGRAGRRMRGGARKGRPGWHRCERRAGAAAAPGQRRHEPCGVSAAPPDAPRRSRRLRPARLRSGFGPLLSALRRAEAAEGEAHGGEPGRGREVHRDRAGGAGGREPRPRPPLLGQGAEALPDRDGPR